MRFSCRTVTKHKEKNNFTYKKRTYNASNKAYGKPSDSSTKAECWGIKDLNRKRGKRGYYKPNTNFEQSKEHFFLFTIKLLNFKQNHFLAGNNYFTSLNSHLCINSFILQNYIINLEHMETYLQTNKTDKIHKGVSWHASNAASLSNRFSYYYTIANSQNCTKSK